MDIFHGIITAMVHILLNVPTLLSDSLSLYTNHHAFKQNLERKTGLWCVHCSLATWIQETKEQR